MQACMHTNTYYGEKKIVSIIPHEDLTTRCARGTEVCVRKSPKNLSPAPPSTSLPATVTMRGTGRHRSSSQRAQSRLAGEYSGIAYELTPTGGEYR